MSGAYVMGNIHKNLIVLRELKSRLCLLFELRLLWA